MKHSNTSWVIAATASMWMGCTLGESGPDDPSPYDSAEITVATPVGAADGVTPVEVTVTGAIGAKLTLVVTGGASFVSADDAEAPTEKTVFLTDVGGVGQATAGVFSQQTGSVAVAFKPEPLRTPREIQFVSVRMAAGVGKETRFMPGLVEHRVCVAVNSPTGSVHAANLVGSQEGVDMIQASAMIDTVMPTDTNCPTTAVDQVGWRGYAVLVWQTFDARAEVDLGYVGSGEEALAVDNVTLEGLAFPGYDVSIDAPQSGPDYVSVDVTVRYLAGGSLPTSPASLVQVEQRFIPAPGPDFLGSSTGDTETIPTTDSAGVVTMFFDPLASGTYAWFARLSGGLNLQLDDLEIP